MKTGFLILFAAAALVGCSKEGERSEKQGDTNMLRGSTTMSNEAAGAMSTIQSNTPPAAVPGSNQSTP